MRTQRPAKIPLILFILMILPTLALAAPPVSELSVLFLAGEDLDRPIADEATAPQRDIRVNVWHDKEEDEPYRRGEAMGVHFSTNADFYVVVYRIDTDGRVEILWPTSRLDDGFVYGNHTYSLPQPGSETRLLASSDKGVEYIEAIASRYPFDLRNLGIDFTFDYDEEGGHDYEIAGDPFLAVNDINYAITGLEEDVDYIVTDWTHLYVDSKVEYARYTCQQCHNDEDDDYQPYVDTCTQVTVYNDWGWDRGWYASFGWYPLYYEPSYYYWDLVSYRSYWFPYYPVYYGWPGYSVYTRPYAIYPWYDSPYYFGDYRVRYKRGLTRVRPLYDVNSPSTRRAIRDRERRVADGRGAPDSIRRAVARDGRDVRVARDRLVRDTMPVRSRKDIGKGSRGGRSSVGDREGSRERRRAGIRADSRRRIDRRITSLQPVTDGRVRGGGDRAVSPGRTAGERRSSERGGRKWTRPVIRNVDPKTRSGARERARSDRVLRSPKQDHRRSGDRSRVDSQRRRGRSDSPSKIDRSRKDGPKSRSSAQVKRRGSRSRKHDDRAGKVQSRRGEKSRGRASGRTSDVRRSPPRSKGSSGRGQSSVRRSSPRSNSKASGSRSSVRSGSRGSSSRSSSGNRSGSASSRRGSSRGGSSRGSRGRG